MEGHNFNEYLAFLRDSLSNLSDYWQTIGYDDPHISHICEALEHADPFILYSASIAATVMLNDKSIYH